MRVLFNREQQQHSHHHQKTSNSPGSPSSIISLSNSNNNQHISKAQETTTTTADISVDSSHDDDDDIKMDSTYRNEPLHLKQHQHHDQLHGHHPGEPASENHPKGSISPLPRKSGLGGFGGGLGRTKSVFSMAGSFVSSTSSLGSASSSHEEDSPNSAHSFGMMHPQEQQSHQQRLMQQHQQHNPQGDDDSDDHFLLNGFGMDVQVYSGLGRPVFDNGLRKVMEPYLRKARSERERARRRSYTAATTNGTCNSNMHDNNNFMLASIANSVGVPYTCLRHERPFLFNEHTFPLHTILAQALGVSDLARLHVEGGGCENVMNNAGHHHHHGHHVPDEVDLLLKPLLDRERRRPFHEAYHNFVTSFCIPLLHSLAISKKLFHTASATCDFVTYRYQAFPRIVISQPGSTGGGGGSASTAEPHCAMARGHAVGCLFFHVPLTPSVETAALYVESHPGREDWHALEAKSVGLGYLYDGARCLQFETTNTTNATRVSMEFSVLIYRESSMKSSLSPSYQQQQQHHPKEDLCTLETLEDSFSRAGPGYYEEAVIDLTRNFYPAGCMDAVHRKNRSLVDPDYRVGPPFVL